MHVPLYKETPARLYLYTLISILSSIKNYGYGCDFPYEFLIISVLIYYIVLNISPRSIKDILVVPNIGKRHVSMSFTTFTYLLQKFIRQKQQTLS